MTIVHKRESISLTIRPYEAHLWMVLPHRCTFFESYRSYLSSDEKQQVDKFVYEDARKDYIITRAFCRSVLSHYAPICPQDWRFLKSAYGRPEIAHADYDLRFNISHTKGLIVCIVASNRAVGIDVEFTDRRINDDELEKIAEYAFSEKELNDLKKFYGEHKKNRFFEYWTLKEAYIKARGLGFHLKTTDFIFDIAQNFSKKVSITFKEESYNRSEDWQFVLLSPTPYHQTAVALHKGTDPDLVIVPINATLPVLQN